MSTCCTKIINFAATATAAAHTATAVAAPFAPTAAAATVHIKLPVSDRLREQGALFIGGAFKGPKALFLERFRQSMLQSAADRTCAFTTGK